MRGARNFQQTYGISSCIQNGHAQKRRAVSICSFLSCNIRRVARSGAANGLTVESTILGCCQKLLIARIACMVPSIAGVV